MPFPTMNPALERALVARAYDEPTAVQLAVLEPESIGRDMLVSAQTGSGKTVAFGLTIAANLLGDAEQFDRAGKPLALIIAPTRELAVQVQRELEWLFAETGARFASCVGGMDPRAERDALAAGAHIVVGTPGRLRDHLERRRLDMSQLRTVVLDEADEMLDLGFREDLQFILDATPAERQTLMFSATVPREIEALARSYQRDAVRIETAVRNQQHADIEYRALRIPPATIEATVVNLLRFYDSPATLVFCATREGVRRMHQGLFDRGFDCVALSGELSQAERTQALDSLREGRAKVLVATDVAARGLDLPELALVIHADLPNDRETLLHRSGRTGRAGRKGISVLIVPPNRRRKAETLLGAARLDPVWAAAPTAREIAAKDQERLLALPILDELATAEDLALGRILLEGRTPEQLAAALIRMHRSGLPVPEDVKDLGRAAPVARPDHPKPYGKPDRAPREQAARPRAEPGAGVNSYARPDRPNMVWFGLNIGREKNADPRWLLPLICRVGDVTKAEIGSIKIADRETRFQIAEGNADQFVLAVKNSKNKEGKIWRIEDGADEPQSDNSDRPTARPHVSKPYKPKPPIAVETAPPAPDHPAETEHDEAAPPSTTAPVANTAMTDVTPVDNAGEHTSAEPSAASAPATAGEFAPITKAVAKPWKKRDAEPAGAAKKPFATSSKFKPDADKPRREPRSEPSREGDRPTAKPWQKRPDAASSHRPSDQSRPRAPRSDAPRTTPHGETRAASYERRSDDGRTNSSAGAKPWQKRPDSGAGGFKKPFNAGASSDKPRTYAGSDKPRTYAGSDKPRTYAGSDKPRTYAGSDKPRTYAGSDKPRTYAGAATSSEDRKPFKDARPSPRHSSEGSSSTPPSGNGKWTPDASRPPQKRFGSGAGGSNNRYSRADTAGGASKQTYHGAKKFKPDGDTQGGPNGSQSRTRSGSDDRPPRAAADGKSSTGRPFKSAYKSKSRT